MPRNSKYYHKMEDTGEIVFDDSMPDSYVEGECPICGKIHSGQWNECDECLQEQQDREDMAEQAHQEWLEFLAQENECDDNISIPVPEDDEQAFIEDNEWLKISPEPEPFPEYVVASTSNALQETYVFSASEEGEINNWIELTGIAKRYGCDDWGNKDLAVQMLNTDEHEYRFVKSLDNGWKTTQDLYKKFPKESL